LKGVEMPARFGHLFKSALKIVTQINREKATGMLEFELKELENIFALLILGGFAGLPSPPSPIAVELLPYMERELTMLLSRTDLAQDPLGVLMSMLEID
jgi:hypothetical protein